MNLSLYSGATGMQAQQMNLNVISNNIANVNTTGYKKNKIEFQDLLYQNPRQSGGQTGAGNVVPTGVEMGNGTKVVSTAKIFTQGQLTQSGEKNGYCD
jgi:flagellar basal-body rod protein FlgG